MKNLFDYIEECGEGCATPGNTMGMGNPMPPTETQPGTEPIQPIQKKKKKKIVKESILDKDFDKAADDKVLKDMFAKVFGTEAFTLDPKTKLVSSKYLNGVVSGGWPEWLKFDEVVTLKLNVDEGEKNLTANLPNKSIRVALEIYESENVTLNGNLNCDELRICGDMKTIKFTGKNKIMKMNLMNCRNLISLSGLEKSQVDSANLPRELVGCIVRDSLKMSKTEFSMCGNVLHE